MHLVAAAKYVERNPVRAKLVEKPWDWIWSSASAHIGKDKAMIPLGDLFKYVEISPDAWKGFIEAGDEDNVVTQIDNSVVTGKPLGSETFVKKLEKKLGRHLMSAPRGRPWRK
jgi:putative transposase